MFRLLCVQELADPLHCPALAMQRRHKSVRKSRGPVPVCCWMWGLLGAVMACSSPTANPMPEVVRGRIGVQAFGDTVGVTRVEVDIAGPGVERTEPNSNLVLTQNGTEWWGELQDVSVGADRSFFARGFDSEGIVIVEGQTVIDEIVSGDNGVVRIRLRVPPRLPNPGIVIYVRSDATDVPSPDGYSWDTAFSTLQEAMEAAEPGHQLWVKRGRYTAALPGRAVLRLKDGIDVLGSFEGNETSPQARPPLSPTDDPTTILDGDWNGSGHMDDEDSPVVVLAVSIQTARLDRLLVQGATQSGMTSLASASELQSMVFRGNGREDYGGGMHNNVGSAAVLNDVRFENNQALGGGGIIGVPATCRESSVIT